MKKMWPGFRGSCFDVSVAADATSSGNGTLLFDDIPNGTVTSLGDIADGSVLTSVVT